MKLFKENGGESLVIAVLVVVVGLVTADPCSKTDVESCKLVCGKTTAPDDEVCIKESGKTTTCRCTDKVGEQQTTSVDLGGTPFSIKTTIYKCETLSSDPPNCSPCDNSRVPYTCTLEAKLNDQPPQSGDFTDCICANKDAMKYTPPAQEQKRRGKFPLILAKLLAALQQVRDRFQGRQ